MTRAALDALVPLVILLAMSVMWSRWHRRYDTSFPAAAGAADQVADIAATILSGCGLTVVTVALFLLTLWWLWR